MLPVTLIVTTLLVVLLLWKLTIVEAPLIVNFPMFGLVFKETVAFEVNLTSSAIPGTPFGLQLVPVFQEAPEAPTHVF